MMKLNDKFQNTKPGEKPFFLMNSFISMLTSLELINNLNPDHLGL